jgi:hypothetical protein
MRAPLCVRSIACTRWLAASTVTGTTISLREKSAGSAWADHYPASTGREKVTRGHHLHKAEVWVGNSKSPWHELHGSGREKWVFSERAKR